MLAAIFGMILFGLLLAIPGWRRAAGLGLHYGPGGEGRPRPTTPAATGTVREKRRAQVGRKNRGKTSHHAGL